MRKIFLNLAIILIFMFTVGTKAFGAFVVTPMEFHLNVPSGEASTGSFWVRNRGEETIALKVYTSDFWIEPDGKEAFLDPGTVERSCSKWIQVAPEGFELAPNEAKIIRFNISVPPEKRGTFWAMIFVEQTTKPTIRTAQKGEQQFNIVSFQRVGVRIYEETPWSEKGEGRISKVDVSRGAKDEFLRVELRFENGGDALLRCKGNIEIKDEKAESISDIKLDEFNCYPKASRIITASFKERLKPGQYSALAVIDYGAEYLVAGEAVFKVNPITGTVEIARPIELVKPIQEAVRVGAGSAEEAGTTQVSAAKVLEEKEAKTLPAEEKILAKEKIELPRPENRFVKAIKDFFYLHFEPIQKRIAQAITRLFNRKR